MKKLLLTLALALAVAGPFASVHAETPAGSSSAEAPRKPGEDSPLRQTLRERWQRGKGTGERPPLTAEQRAKVREFFQAHREEIIERIKAARAGRGGVRKAGTHDAPTAPGLSPLVL